MPEEDKECLSEDNKVIVPLSIVNGQIVNNSAFLDLFNKYHKKGIYHLNEQIKQDECFFGSGEVPDSSYPFEVRNEPTRTNYEKYLFYSKKTNELVSTFFKAKFKAIDEITFKNNLQSCALDEQFSDIKITTHKK